MPTRDLDETPRFRFAEEQPREILRAVRLDLSLLLLASIAGMAMARRAYRRPSVV